MILEAKNYAVKCHSETNHLYDGKDYEFHLNMVYQTALKFIHLIPEKERDNVLAACWTHDVIEDCHQTYNDVKAALNKDIAELSYALSNEKGKNRKERANDKYYKGIRETPYAVFVKVCDRIANFQYSREKGGRMAEMYEKEMIEFINNLYDAKYEELFNYLKSI